MFGSTKAQRRLDIERADAMIRMNRLDEAERLINKMYQEDGRERPGAGNWFKTPAMAARRPATKAGPLDAAEARARQLATQHAAPRWSGMKAVDDLSTMTYASGGSVARTVWLEAQGGRLLMGGSPVVRRVSAGTTRYGAPLVELTSADGHTARVMERDL